MQEHQTPFRLVQYVTLTQLSFQHQLIKEGPDSVATVVFPALAPTLDKSLKADRSQSEPCTTIWIGPQVEQGADLCLFRKSFDEDISSATIYTWIKQTVILSYELSDQVALTLHQVKAHNVRAFAASKAFCSRVFLEQLLSACQWKSHNTFTQFYLKDVAWADSELFHLDPVVTAEQIHQ